VVDGAELLRLIDANAFSLDALDALLADLPGDLRAGVQKALGEQPAAARLLPLKPEQIADPQYTSSAPSGAGRRVGARPAEAAPGGAAGAGGGPGGWTRARPPT
jgi:hypothetical protein